MRMNAVTTQLLIDDSGQVVLLPNEVAFPDDVTEVEVIVSGSARWIVPRGERVAIEARAR